MAACTKSPGRLLFNAIYMSQDEAPQPLLKGICFCGLTDHCGKEVVRNKDLIFMSPVSNEVIE